MLGAVSARSNAAIVILVTSHQAYAHGSLLLVAEHALARTSHGSTAGRGQPIKRPASGFPVLPHEFSCRPSLDGPYPPRRSFSGYLRRPWRSVSPAQSGIAASYVHEGLQPTWIVFYRRTGLLPDGAVRFVKIARLTGSCGLVSPVTSHATRWAIPASRPRGFSSRAHPFAYAIPPCDAVVPPTCPGKSTG